jgi:hypothetical protein
MHCSVCELEDCIRINLVNLRAYTLSSEQTQTIIDAAKQLRKSNLTATWTAQASANTSPYFNWATKINVHSSAVTVTPHEKQITVERARGR